MTTIKALFSKLTLARESLRVLRQAFLANRDGLIAENAFDPGGRLVLAEQLDEMLAQMQNTLDATAHDEPVDYEAMGHAAASAARKRKRDAFQTKWGDYVKCSKCGGPVLAGGYAWASVDSACCQAPVIRNGYAPPPEAP